MPTTILWGESIDQARARRFAEEAEVIKAMRQRYIDGRVEELMKDPVGLLCEVDDCNPMLIAVLKAVTHQEHVISQAELNDALFGYAVKVAGREWERSPC